ncbi:exodeoxyribonuclease III [Palleronia abyssalis]|uniref:Exodeoxyribonuclease III n=1 Tax=Palleronia abyssalis TaxID=1501240 RepID=A0A2R8BU91_9RHOB|nr:exodeoxyribonuclease III [Palleronia abyssalis]SPJ23721.1 Exodeoxyribonuclease III [Palleronia abyssalis]
MKIATFNINGVKARLPVLLDWLAESAPDVACLQEIKSTDETFPREQIEDLGYTLHTHGQKSFNGVAILSKLPLEDVTRGLPGDEADEQARYIEATVMGDRAVRVCCLYLPNGNPAPGPKYDYKLAWMERLRARVAEIMALEEPAVFCGDYNVIPNARDAARPDKWTADALYLPDTRTAFRRLMHGAGLTDALRVRDGNSGLYTFWDYQRGAWEKNDGIRIDHHLLTPQAADLLEDCRIESDLRAREKPSDHVPVWITLAA